ncbi:hypothetical protein AGMMS4956_19330 [Bacteroidia bacterium]|nr:hypothetical protein AGMMS4956_19330 [Bacteroidia bacterium]
MFEYHNNNFCVQSSALVEMGFITYNNYNVMVQRGKLNVVRRGCRATPALVNYDSLSDKWKQQIESTLKCNPRTMIQQNEIMNLIVPDDAAMEYFTHYQLPSGDLLIGRKKERVFEYYANAQVLNAMRILLQDKRSMRKVRGIYKNVNEWQWLAQTVNAIDRNKMNHTLPANERRLRDCFNRYQKEGYSSLIHRNYGNQHTRKVTELVERLLLGICVMDIKPYAEWVCDYYLQFLAGTKDVVDMKTGELFNRQDFVNAKGEYITISRATVWNYLNNPKNKTIIDSVRMDRHRFNHLVRPHSVMDKPKFSLSMVTFDDVDLQRLLPKQQGEKRHVFAYYAYDVCSGALIGKAYGRKKNDELLIDCIRDMFRFLCVNGYGMPREAQVENAIWSKYKDSFAQANILFPYFTFCEAQNSQQKYAEHFNRVKKYSFEKRHHTGVGRHYSKLEENSISNYTRVYDEDKAEYIFEPNKSYTFEQIVADDLEVIADYNAGKHWEKKDPDFADKSRMEVFQTRINRNVTPIDYSILTRYIGEHTETSLQRNMYVQVQSVKYMLPTPKVIQKLAPNNYDVDAYYLVGADGSIDNVYLWQNDRYLCECAKLVKYQVAKDERTAEDDVAELVQNKYKARFDKMVSDGAEVLPKAKIISATSEWGILDDKEVEVLEVTPDGPKTYLEQEAERYDGDYEEEYVVANALDSI